MEGKVWLVGAGPYDEGLFTLKGKAVLEQADVVVYDHLVGIGILQMIPEQARQIDVGKCAGNHKVVQEEINRILLQEAGQGKKVVRLKGGDPFLFGRGGEELELLEEHHIPFEVVPGVSSSVAVPAYAGIPVTHRDYASSLHIITGHKKKGNREPIAYKQLAAQKDGTLVFLMSIGELGNICKGLLDAGMDKGMPAAVLENGTSSRQRRVIGTIGTLPEKAKAAVIGTPGMLIVGKVCSLSGRFHWAEDRALGGARVFLTRPEHKNSVLAQKLYDLGADVVKLPAIRTIPLQIGEGWERAEKVIDDYAWFVFTSAAAVTCFFRHLEKIRKDIRSLPQIRFAAVGKATKREIESHGVLVDYLPENCHGQALGAGLSQQIPKGKKALVFVPKNTESSCVVELGQQGALCDTIEAYETVYAPGREIELWPDDIAVFTSASTVRGFAHIMKDRKLSKVWAVCIGEQTAEEAKRHDMDCAISEEATIDSLIDAVLKVYQNIRKKGWKRCGTDQED